MAQISPAQLAVILCAFCFITQVWSQSSTLSPNNATSVNQTANGTVATAATQITTKTSSGAGFQPQASLLSPLIAVALTSGLLRHWC